MLLTWKTDIRVKLLYRIGLGGGFPEKGWGTKSVSEYLRGINYYASSVAVLIDSARGNEYFTLVPNRFRGWFSREGMGYKISDPHHFNKLKRNDTWEEIARDTGRSAEQCRKKIKYLHHHYRHNYRHKCFQLIGASAATEHLPNNTDSKSIIPAYHLDTQIRYSVSSTLGRLRYAIMIRYGDTTRLDLP
ncbi:hypothetical protein EAI_12240 [Harpegnathos saltator]|uniref:MADF domain-containing protein n=1 Tax=Harpegnathos saltator TaxID=610380 RepID=E2B3P1_HARSA|nr:hypothetical protein EAI_12240 [Harpegnathos saltator]